MSRTGAGICGAGDWPDGVSDHGEHSAIFWFSLHSVGPLVALYSQAVVAGGADIPVCRDPDRQECLSYH
jgi:hypothetical protein